MILEKFSKIKNWLLTHKKTSLILILILIFLGYKIYQNYTSTAGVPKYIISTVKKGVITTTVTGSGQVSANNQIDIKSKVSGDITGVYVKPGQTVTIGTLLAQVDSRDAQLSLESAQIAYEKLVQASDPQDVKSAENNLASAYNDGWNAVSSTFIDYPTLITNMDNLFYGSNGYLSNSNSFQRSDISRAYIQKAGVSYDQAKNQYEIVLQEYNSLSRLSATSSLKTLIADTHQMVKIMADALKNTQNTISYIMTIDSDTSTDATVTASNINTWLSSINTHLSNILSSQNSVANNENSLNNLLKGADSLDVRSQEISLQKAQNTYQDYSVRAPFNGVVARVPVKVGDPASSATIATLVSTQKIAEISLNEVDVAKIKNGDKVNLTFDAIDNLNITGEITEIDLVGTVSSGVVNYNVKIGFDTQDERVKSGMSVNASIITANKENILIVPSSSLKSEKGKYFISYFAKYPEIIDKNGIISTTLPLSKPVEIGFSDDTNTEIISGLNEGDKIISRITNTITTTKTTTPSLFGGSSNTRRIGG